MQNLCLRVYTYICRTTLLNKLHMCMYMVGAYAQAAENQVK